MRSEKIRKILLQFIEVYEEVMSKEIDFRIKKHRRKQRKSMEKIQIR